MRKSLLSLALAALAAFTFLIPATGQANDPPVGDDLVGLYTAESFADPDIADNIDAAVLDFIDLYMIVTGITAPSDGISGFEALITVTEGSSVTGADHPTSYLDFASADEEFAVGFSTPLFTTDGTLYIASIEVLVAAAVDSLKIGPNTTPSIAGEMVYTDGNTAALKIIMTAASGDNSLPVCGINTGPLDIVPTDTRTWTDVKNLYR